MRDPLERGLFRPVKDFDALVKELSSDPGEITLFSFRGHFLPILTRRRRLGDWTRDTDAQFKSLERWGYKGALVNN